MKSPKTPVAVSFETVVHVDMNSQNSCTDMVFFLNFAALTEPALMFDNHNGLTYLLGGLAVNHVLANNIMTSNVRHKLQL